MTLPSRPVDERRAPGRGFWPIRDIPTVLWLVLAVVAAVVHRELPVPRWLLIHLLLLGAVSHAILVWSQFFALALLRTAASRIDRRMQSIRLLLANGGAAAVVIGVPTQLGPVTAAGAAAIIVAVAWHGASLVRRLRTALPGRFGHNVRYYVVAAALLTLGAAIGAWLALGPAAPNLVLAHALVNVLGWIGLTVAGTVVTLWPTILRTRADERAPLGAARALPWLAAGVLVAALGAALSSLPVLAAGLAGYLAGLVVIGVSLGRASREAPPRSFAAMSVGAALLWWAGSVVTLIVGASTAFITGSGLPGLVGVVDGIVPFLAAGFAAQVLVGALSYLTPVVLGGGPTPVRTGTSGFDRLGPLRVAVANVALVVCALPVSSLIRVAASILYLLAMASFLPIMLVAMREQRRAKAQGAVLEERRHGPIAPEGEQPRGRRAGQAVAGLIAVVLTVAACAAADPVPLGWGDGAVVDETAPVMTVQVEAIDMRFTPDVIEVPHGTRLVIELTNTDRTQVHDLVFANGVAGERLWPGDSETIDVGVITGDLEGWCSVVGHRQMGMELTVVATGVPASGGSDEGTGGATTDDGTNARIGHATHGGIADGVDLAAAPGAGFAALDAALPPLAPADGPTTHRIELTARDTVVEVAPGVTQTLWTYGDTAPGPVLHGRVGDVFEVTLVNDGTIGHSIDFHASALAPDGPMRTIAPGERLTYTFTAQRAGVWMYHCSTAPMTAHIANGMYGAVVIEPPGLPDVDRSYVLVQGEYYLGDHDAGEVDVAKIAARRPDLVVFNGYADQYAHEPLPARVGERVRVWVLDAGIERATSFHVVGGQFDTVWSEGRYLVDRAADTGSQALGLLPGQGGFVELRFPEAGNYPFVSHFMLDAELGAHGVFRVADAG